MSCATINRCPPWSTAQRCGQILGFSLHREADHNLLPVFGEVMVAHGCSCPTDPDDSCFFGTSFFRHFRGFPSFLFWVKSHVAKPCLSGPWPAQVASHQQRPKIAWPGATCSRGPAMLVGKHHEYPRASEDAKNNRKYTRTGESMEYMFFFGGVPWIEADPRYS